MSLKLQRHSPCLLKILLEIIGVTVIIRRMYLFYKYIYIKYELDGGYINAISQ